MHINFMLTDNTVSMSENNIFVSAEEDRLFGGIQDDEITAV